MPFSLCVHIIAHDPNCEPRLESARRLARALVAGFEDCEVKWISLPPEAVTMDKLRERCGTGDDRAPTRFDEFKQPMTAPHISNCLHHAAALRSVLEADDRYDVHLVLEDDAHCDEATVCERLESVVAESPDDADVIFLGQMTDLAHGRFADYRTQMQTLATCESYVLNRSAAEAILPHLTPVRYHTPVQLSFAAERAGVTAWICSPTLFADGSKLGVVPSSVSPNNACMYNPLYKKIYALLRSAGDIASDQLQRMCESNPLRESPDFLHIEGVVAMRRGDLEAAMAIFERALDQYLRFGGLVGNSSKFLHDYVSLSRLTDK